MLHLQFWENAIKVYHALCAIFFSRTIVPTDAILQGGPIKTAHFKMCITSVYDDVGRRSVYKTVRFFIRSKTDISNVATFKYSLHNFT